MKLSSMLLYGLLLSGSHAATANNDILRYSSPDLSLKKLGTYNSGIIDASAAEIVAYDAKTYRVFVTNASSNSVDVLSIRYPHYPKKLFSLDVSLYGEPNSVAVSEGIVAVAIAAEAADTAGKVVLFNRNGRVLNTLEVGFLPDMVTFSPDGKTLLVANEGEPNEDYTIDPEGSISVITLSRPIRKMTQANVVTADFSAFTDVGLLDDSVRIFGPNASIAQDIEPEYITVSKDSSTAYVALQENNALAVVDIASAQVTDIIGLGTKNYNTVATAMDASDRDDAINIQPWPVLGFYQPDSIAAYEYDGDTYIVMANEGDARDYDGFSEEERVDDLTLDGRILAMYPAIQEDEQLGRLKTTTVNGDVDGDGDVDQIYSYGGRSFSILHAETGTMVYDSGSDFARITAATSTALFNGGDHRSDDKGAEPEALTLGRIGEKMYAFIGLERTGGIMVYDITSPQAPQFVEYVNNTNSQGDVDEGTAGDIAPEGLYFVPAKDSPVKQPLLVVANEVSGTTTMYVIHTQKKTSRFSRPLYSSH